MKRYFLLAAMFVLPSGINVLAQAAGQDKSKEWSYGPYDKLHLIRLRFLRQQAKRTPHHSTGPLSQSCCPRIGRSWTSLATLCPTTLASNQTSHEAHALNWSECIHSQGRARSDDEKESFFLWIMPGIIRRSRLRATSSAICRRSFWVRMRQLRFTARALRLVPRRGRLGRQIS